jgi:hypothetical protein
MFSLIPEKLHLVPSHHFPEADPACVRVDGPMEDFIPEIYTSEKRRKN